MSQIIGVRFNPAGRIYYFHASGLGLSVNDDIVVQTSQGLEVGKVVIPSEKISTKELNEPLKPVLRKADDSDFARIQSLQKKDRDARIKCQELIKKYNLPMKLLSANWSLDGSCLSFLFSSEERVDFRALVKELTRTFKSRVELRQVGARDEAKIVGGYGRCGRPLCCATYLTSFESVSMKMAKEQDLPLNPDKISGVCGRLLCCLGYECDQYKEMKAKLPKAGQIVATEEGTGKVIGGNPLKETVSVRLESDAVLELPLAKLLEKENKAAKQKQSTRTRSQNQPAVKAQSKVNPKANMKAKPNPKKKNKPNQKNNRNNNKKQQQKNASK